MNNDCGNESIKIKCGNEIVEITTKDMLKYFDELLHEYYTGDWSDKGECVHYMIKEIRKRINNG